jgi:hypothetical protein
VFDLRLTPAIEICDDAAFYRGTIVLGDFSEEFLAAASLWEPTAYQGQWQAAARALVADADRTAFVTSFVHPDGLNTIWPAWKLGHLVYVQNRLLDRSQLASILDVARIAEVVGDREVVSEDGEPLSEWVVTLDDVAAFAV